VAVDNSIVNCRSRRVEENSLTIPQVTKTDQKPWGTSKDDELEGTVNKQHSSNRETS